MWWHTRSLILPKGYLILGCKNCISYFSIRKCQLMALTVQGPNMLPVHKDLEDVVTPSLRHFPLWTDLFFSISPPPAAPVLCLWHYSRSGGPHLCCRCGSHTVCNRTTGRCRCWLGGSPCLVAAPTCKAGRTVSSHQNSVSVAASRHLGGFPSLSKWESIVDADMWSQTRAVVGVWQLSSLCAAAATCTRVDNGDVLSVRCSPPPILLNPSRVQCVHLTAAAEGHLAFCHPAQLSYLVSKMQAVPQWQVLLDDGRFVRFSLLKWG